MKKIVLITLMITLPVILSGCSISKSVHPETGHYYLNPRTNFANISRVVMFELDDQTNVADISSILTRSISDALSKKHLFSLKTLYRSDPTWRRLDLDNAASYSIEELELIRDQLKADAVIFGTVTRYSPYPHLATGLHLKMVDLRNGQVIWGIEQIWDSTDKSVERRMRRYFKVHMRSGYEPIDWQLFVSSPRAFNKYVAFEAVFALPRAGVENPSRSSEKILGLREKTQFFKNSVNAIKKGLKFGR